MNVLTISQAANILDISTKTLKRWETEGRVKPSRNAQNHRRYSLLSLHHVQQPSTSDASLSINQVASEYQISPRTLRRWEDNGLISVSRNARNQRVYQPSTLKQIQKLLEAKGVVSLSTIKRLKAAYPTLTFLAIGLMLVPTLISTFNYSGLSTTVVPQHDVILLAKNIKTENSNHLISSTPPQSQTTNLPSTSHLQNQPVIMNQKPVILPTPAGDIRLSSNQILDYQSPSLN